jgi:hypothetical protein
MAMDPSSGSNGATSPWPAALTARAVVGYAAVRQLGVTLAAVARQLGVSGYSVARALRRAENLDAELRDIRLE